MQLSDPFRGVGSYPPPLALYPGSILLHLKRGFYPTPNTREQRERRKVANRSGTVRNTYGLSIAPKRVSPVTDESFATVVNLNGANRS